MTPPRLTYRFGPLERRGLLGPIRTGQAMALAIGALVAVATLDEIPTTAGAFGGLLVLTLAAAFATAPIAGRTPEEWAPVAGAYATRAARRQLTFRSAAPQTGVVWSLRHQTVAEASSRAPDALNGLQIREVAYRGRRLGAITERGDRRLTAVLACRVVSFALLDPAAQERRLSHWGLILASAAGTPIRRLQWIERTAPAQGDELARWLHSARDPAIPLRGTAIVESYLELIETTARVTHEHEILVAVQVDGAKVRERGPGAVEQALVEQAERIARGLEAAEVTVLGALSPGQLARSLRTAVDPYVRPALTALETVDPARDGLAMVNAWPIGTRESWEHYRCDGAHHATYWIGGWPRVEVSPMFMDAMLGGSGAVRTVAVTFEPVSPGRSTREVEAAITRDRADSELRRRFGQSETARQRQAQESAMRREAELAAGHGEVRLAGFVTVSGRDEEDLRRACAEVLEHAARARLELHRMYGQQAAAFTFTLPAAGGLR